MKRLIFLTNHLEYPDGVAKSLLNLCNNLDLKKYKITVIALFRCDNNFISQFEKKIKIKKIFGFYFRGLGKLLNFLPASWLYKYIVREEFDIEIGFQYGIATKIIANSLNHNAKHVLWMHGYDEGLVMRECYKKVDMVVNVSKCNAKRLQNEMVNEIKTTYCYNIADDVSIQEKAKELIDIKIHKRPLLISVSRHSPEKGYLRLINILAELKTEGLDFECWLIGDGPEHLKIRDRIKELGLQEDVLLIGATNNPHKYTAKADIFVCSSYSEGYSTACTEAAILGIPIITTNVSGAEELIEMAECGIVVGLEDNELKEGLRMVLRNPELINIWKEKMMQTKEYFTLENRKREILNIFENILQ